MLINAQIWVLMTHAGAYIWTKLVVKLQSRLKIVSVNLNVSESFCVIKKSNRSFFFRISIINNVSYPNRNLFSSTLIFHLWALFGGIMM